MGFAGQRIYRNRARGMAVVTLGAHTQAPYLSAIEPDRDRELAAFTRGVLEAARGRRNNHQKSNRSDD